MVGKDGLEEDGDGASPMSAPPKMKGGGKKETKRRGGRNPGAEHEEPMELYFEMDPVNADRGYVELGGFQRFCEKRLDLVNTAVIRLCYNSMMLAGDARGKVGFFSNSPDKKRGTERNSPDIVMFVHEQACPVPAIDRRAVLWMSCGCETWLC